MKKKWMNYFLSVLMILSGIIMIMVVSLQFYSYNVSWYVNRMDKYEISEYTGINNSDIKKICRTLTEYLNGRKQDIDVTADVYGVSREVFNEKEKQHMVDVRNIFDIVRLLTPISVIFFIGCSLALFKGYDKKNFYRSLLLTGIILPLTAVVPVVAALIDFHSVFTLFHELFFSNDLWLLDPRTDILIQMLPQSFFESTALLWFITAMIFFIICTVVGILGLKRIKQSKH